MFAKRLYKRILYNYLVVDFLCRDVLRTSPPRWEKNASYHIHSAGTLPLPPLLAAGKPPLGREGAEMHFESLVFYVLCKEACHSE
jgi:hypothetical protein